MAKNDFLAHIKSGTKTERKPVIAMQFGKGGPQTALWPQRDSNRDRGRDVGSRIGRRNSPDDEPAYPSKTCASESDFSIETGVFASLSTDELRCTSSFFASKNRTINDRFEAADEYPRENRSRTMALQ